jgi:hypothetical protein
MLFALVVVKGGSIAFPLAAFTQRPAFLSLGPRVFHLSRRAARTAAVKSNKTLAGSDKTRSGANL